MRIVCPDTESYEKNLFKNNTSYNPFNFIVYHVLFFNHYSPFSGGYHEQQARNDSGNNEYCLECFVGL